MRGVGSVLGLTIGLKPGSSALDLPGSLRSLRAGARAEGPEYQAAAVAGRAAPAYTDIWGRHEGCAALWQVAHHPSAAAGDLV